MRNLRQIFVAFLLLFVATTAMAQSQSDNIDGNTTTAVRADVNGDGVVNEADIAEIIAIMKNAGGIAEQPKYYWYVGQEAVTADNYTTLDGVTQVTSYPIKYEYTPSKRARLYIVIADNKTITKIEDAVSFATATFSEDTSVSIPGYKVYKTGGAVGGKVNIYIN